MLALKSVGFKRVLALQSRFVASNFPRRTTTSFLSAAFWLEEQSVRSQRQIGQNCFASFCGSDAKEKKGLSILWLSAFPGVVCRVEALKFLGVVYTHVPTHVHTHVYTHVYTRTQVQMTAFGHLSLPDTRARPWRHGMVDYRCTRPLNIFG